MEKKNFKKSIVNQFNSDLRVNEMLYSYGLLKKEVATNSLEFDPYEKLRENTIFKNINTAKKNKVLDIGCGFGNLVATLVDKKQNAYGLDLSETLVQNGKELFKKKGIDENRIFTADFLKYKPKIKYNLTIANGVIWYYKNRFSFLKKINQITASKGETLIVHRNDLFNVLCFNNGTIDFLNRNDFFLNNNETYDLLKKEIPELDQSIIKHSSSALKKYFDNPLTIHELYAKAGFEILKIQYLYIHPAPPRLKKNNTPADFKKAHLKYVDHWQGMFMGSQFLVHARKIKDIR